MTSRKLCDEKIRPARRRLAMSTLKCDSHQQWSGERGYTLVALLAAMTIILLLIMAAAPSVRQQAQRSREEEAIARGEEVAEAIRIYTVRKAVPTSMEQLLEGIPVPGGARKVQILRAEAAIDPLSSSGKWKLIKKTDATFLAFQRAVVVYAGGRTPDTRDTNFTNPAKAGPVPTLTNVLNLDEKEEPPGGEDDSEDSTGPFIGVASRSRRASVITYYGIARHDQWVFTPYFR